MNDYEIINGHVIDGLKRIAAGEVQCVVTSPPYYGLRCYGVPPQIWPPMPSVAALRYGAPSDAWITCNHEWQEKKACPRNTARNGKGGNSIFEGREDKAAINDELENEASAGGTFCRKCGAWLGDLGLEPSPELYLWHIVAIFRELRRVLRPDGVIWFNIGDTYAGSGGLGSQKPTDLIGIPWRIAFAVQADGYYLRSDVIWNKINPMPEPTKTRPTKAHEYIFLFSKSRDYFYDNEAVKVPCSESGLRDLKGRKKKDNKAGTYSGVRKDLGRGRGEYYSADNKRNLWTVWTLPPQKSEEGHYAQFPEALADTCIKAGTSEKGSCRNCGAPWVRIVKRLDGTNEDGAAVTITVGFRPSCSCYKANYDATFDRSRKQNRRRYEEVTGLWIERVKSQACPDTWPRIACLVCDPFSGSGTTGAVALRLNRRFTGTELNPDYVSTSTNRLLRGATGVTKPEQKEGQKMLWEPTGKVSI